ncbi:MAG: GAF domain-containing protein [Chloroflexi bacterium]|nr:GAF domain-containing protein [Chloroflexota bacterium]
MKKIFEIVINFFPLENFLSALGLSIISGILIWIIYRLVSRVTPKLHKAQIIDKIITQILDNANKMVMRELRIDIRSCIFYADSERDKLRLFFTSSDFDGNSPERNISFNKGSGIVGKCWTRNEPLIGNLENKKYDELKGWNITKRQYRITKYLTAVIAIPIQLSDNSEKVIGILAFDSKQKNAYNKFKKDELISIATKHAILAGRTFEKIGLN